VIALFFGVVLGYFGYTAVNNSGILQKNVTAATIGERKLTSAMLNYFYLDAIANQYSSWRENFSTSTDTYLSQYFGLDVNKELDEQYYNEETKTTWADYFIDVAISDAQASYAIYDIAQSKNYKLSADAKEELDGWVENYEYMAEMYKSSVDEVVVSNYGPGATFESWKEYLTVIITAQDYAEIQANHLPKMANAYALENVEVTLGTTELAGTSYPSVYLTSEMVHVPHYERYVYIQRGNYLYTVLCSCVEVDRSEALLALFTAV
jgi:hypothetical protein